jgi:hypothetical protein
MAKKRIDKEVAARLHASGVRSRTADLIAAATDGRRKPAKQVRAIIKEMRKALAEVEDRATGGPAKRSAAAKKAAATRKRNAAKRSASAKKGARTKAKAKSGT